MQTRYNENYGQRGRNRFNEQDRNERSDYRSSRGQSGGSLSQNRRQGRDENYGRQGENIWGGEQARSPREYGSNPYGESQRWRDDESVHGRWAGGENAGDESDFENNDYENEENDEGLSFSDQDFDNDNDQEFEQDSDQQFGRQNRNEEDEDVDWQRDENRGGRKRRSYG